MRAGLPHLQRIPTPRFVSCNPSMRLTCYLASLLSLGENRRRAVVTRGVAQCGKSSADNLKRLPGCQKHRAFIGCVTVVVAREK